MTAILKRLRGVLVLGTTAFALIASVGATAAADTTSTLVLSCQKSSVRVAQGFRAGVKISTTPASVKTGIDCGMAEMCGIDPCTCGSADDYGHCSCNGTKPTPPTFKVTSSDSRVATAAYQNGKLVIRGVSPGTASVTVQADLMHIGSTQQTLAVTVTPSPVPYVAAGVVAIAIVATAAVLWRRKKHGCKREEPL